MEAYRLRRLSEENQKLKNAMLEIQRLRELVALAQVEVRGPHTKKGRSARGKVLRLVVDASVGSIANCL